jgi:hypothetical protein
MDLLIMKFNSFHTLEKIYSEKHKMKTQRIYCPDNKIVLIGNFILNHSYQANDFYSERVT